MEPFNLPKGSLRAIIVVTSCGILCFLLLIGKPVPPSLGMLFAGVIGYYFGKAKAFTESPEPNPLYLPPGSIRLIVVFLLLVTSVILWLKGLLFHDRIMGDLVALTLGFAVGNGGRFLFKKFGKFSEDNPIVDLFRHVKGLLILVVIIALVVYIATNSYTTLPWQWRGAFLALVAFYFGSRS